jgi:hypothetical protein
LIGSAASIARWSNSVITRNGSLIRQYSRVNTPPPKGGGFRLRLKAGSVRHVADLGVTGFTAPRPRRTHCPASWAVARRAHKFDVPQSKRDGASPILRAASHAA